MVARVNGAIAAGQFLGHDVDHWSSTGVDLTVAANAQAFIDAVETKASVILIGVLTNAAGNTRFAVESPSAWTAASLSTATGATVTAFVY